MSEVRRQISTASVTPLKSSQKWTGGNLTRPTALSSSSGSSNAIGNNTDNTTESGHSATSPRTPTLPRVATLASTTPRNLSTTGTARKLNLSRVTLGGSSPHHGSSTPLSARPMTPLPRIATLPTSKPESTPVQKSFPKGKIYRNENGEFEYVDDDGSLRIDKVLRQLEEAARTVAINKIKDITISDTSSADEKNDTLTSSLPLENDISSSSSSSSSPSSSSSSSASIECKSNSSTPSSTPRLIILTLSGAFAPVHVAHLQMFDTAKAYLEHQDPNTFVVAGYLSVSGDAFMRMKVQGERQHMPLEERAKMCKLACRESTFVDVCEYGWTSSERVAEKIRYIVKRLVKDTTTLRTDLNDATIDVVQLCGANNALKNRLYMRGTYLAISRPQTTSRLIADVANARSRQDPSGPSHRFRLIDQEVEGFSLPVVTGVSSVTIRELLFSHDKPQFAELEKLGWLHGSVLDNLKQAFQRFGWLCRR